MFGFFELCSFWGIRSKHYVLLDFVFHPKPNQLELVVFIHEMVKTDQNEM